MKYANYTILLKEIPGKISLCFALTGCPMKCKGCHSYELWEKNHGKELTYDSIKEISNQYKGLFDVILFFGGEWNGIEFISLIKSLKEDKYSLGLYTGLDVYPLHLEKYFDYIKFGGYKKELGGLESETTNQRLIQIQDGIKKDLTSEFWKSYTIK